MQSSHLKDDPEVKKYFLQEIRNSYDDGIARYFVPEVNNISNIQSIVNDLRSAGIEFVDPE